MKTLILIDGANASESLKLIKRQFNYLGMRWQFSNITRTETGATGNWPQIRYYTAIYQDDSGYVALKPYMDKLAYDGIIVVSKPAKVVQRDDKKSIKGNMDVELTTDALTMAQYFDRIVLLSGDGDFCYLVEKLRALGKFVVIVSTVALHGDSTGLAENCTIIADELRKAGDLFINLNDPNDKLAANLLTSKPARES